VIIKTKELRQHDGKGGWFDILAYDVALDTQAYASGMDRGGYG
jgi:hypothetical protein